MVINIPTWRCSCGYAQDYDPTDATLHALHHPGVPTGNCPACHTARNPDRTKRTVALQREANPDKKCKVSVSEETDVPNMQVPDELNRGQMRKLTATEQAQKVLDIRTAQAFWKARECKFTG